MTAFLFGLRSYNTVPVSNNFNDHTVLSSHPKENNNKHLILHCGLPLNGSQDTLLKTISLLQPLKLNLWPPSCICIKTSSSPWVSSWRPVQKWGLPCSQRSTSRSEGTMSPRCLVGENCILPVCMKLLQRLISKYVFGVNFPRETSFIFEHWQAHLIGVWIKLL